MKWPLDETQGVHGRVQKAVIKIKVVRPHDGPDAVLAKALKPVAGYADLLGADETYVVMFDQRPGRTWEERIWHRPESHAGRTIGVWGM